MKVTYTTKNGKMTAELEGDTQTALWQELAIFQEVFEETTCARCKKDNLRFILRTDDDDNKYYELKCQESGCYAKLAFGCHKKGGGLFPKRKGEDGKIKGMNGWVKYNKDTQKEE